MDDIHIQKASDLATQLLNSKDSRVAAAAKRIFSQAIIAETCQESENSLSATNAETPFPHGGINGAGKGTGGTDACVSSSHNEIPTDIREAASAVAMLDSKRRATPSPNPLPLTMEARQNDKSPVKCVSSSVVSSTGPGTRITSTPPCNGLHPKGSPPPVTPTLNSLNALAPVERKKATSQAERLHRR